MGKTRGNGKCKRSQVPEDNHPGAHRRAEPPKVPDERDTLTRCAGLAKTQTPTHSLIHQYGLTLTCQTGGLPQSLSSFPGAETPSSRCWEEVATNAGAPCWGKVLQPPAPSKRTKATLRVRVQAGAGLKTRNLQSGVRGRDLDRPPTLPAPRLGSSLWPVPVAWG